MNNIIYIAILKGTGEIIYSDASLKEVIAALKLRETGPDEVTIYKIWPENMMKFRTSWYQEIPQGDFATTPKAKFKPVEEPS